MPGELLERDVYPDDGAVAAASLGERRADLAGREEDVGAGPHDGVGLHGLPVPVAGSRVEAVVRSRIVPGHAELPVKIEEAPRGRAIGGGDALDEKGDPRRRLEGLPDRVAQRAHQEEVAVAIADVDGGDLGMRGERRGEERDGLEPFGQRARPRDPMLRQQLDEESGRGQEVPHTLGRVLRDAKELLVAGRQQETRGGAVAVADDRGAGDGDEHHEQGRDVDPEPEPTAGGTRPGGGGARARRGCPARWRTSSRDRWPPSAPGFRPQGPDGGYLVDPRHRWEPPLTAEPLSAP